MHACFPHGKWFCILVWSKWSLGFFFLKFEVSILRIVKLKKKKTLPIWRYWNILPFRTAVLLWVVAGILIWRRKFFLVIINKQFIICDRYFHSCFLYHRLIIFSVSKAVGVASLGCYKLFVVVVNPDLSCRALWVLVLRSLVRILLVLPALCCFLLAQITCSSCRVNTRSAWSNAHRTHCELDTVR